MARELLEQPSTIDFPLTLDIHSLGLTEEQFDCLCRDNRDLRIELTAKGELTIMPPTGSVTGWRNARINYRLNAGAERDGTCITFDSSTGFRLPNGAKRSPDASWIRLERWNALTDEDKEGFAPLCPDFVVELRSSDDRLSTLQEKMEEYMENGARLGWLFDPRDRKIDVYRPGEQPVSLDNPQEISGDPVLKGFVFAMKEIW